MIEPPTRPGPTRAPQPPAGMRFSNVIHLYRVRLRARGLQETLAIVGIAAGVGLLFASQIASSSLSSSVGKLNSGIVGRASLQITARDPHGFDARVLTRVRHLQGVRLAAGLIEASANAVGPKGSESCNPWAPIRASPNSAARWSSARR